MLQTDALESAICLELARVGTCSLDELNERLPYYSWNQVFLAVDRLNRAGTVALKHPAPFLCFLSLALGRGTLGDAGLNSDTYLSRAPEKSGHPQHY